MSNKILLKVPEAAERVQVGVSTLRALLARGEIDCIRVGRAVRVPVPALEAWIERKLQGEI
jgi:excisionase family DNA binding protein